MTRLKEAAADAANVISGMGLSIADSAFGYKKISETMSEAERKFGNAKQSSQRNAVIDGALAQLDMQLIHLVNIYLRQLSDRIGTIKALTPPEAMRVAVLLIEGRLRDVELSVAAIATSQKSGGATFGALADRPLSECRYIDAIVSSFEKSLRDARRWWGGPRDLLFRLLISFLVGLVLLPLGLVVKEAWERQVFHANRDQGSPTVTMPQQPK